MNPPNRNSAEGGRDVKDDSTSAGACPVDRQLFEANVSESVPEAILELADRLGVRNITAWPGCWEYQVDERWWFALNGKKHAQVCTHGVEVPPFHFYVEFVGWPAGVFNLRGEGEFAAGAEANEDAFIKAIDAARAREEAEIAELRKAGGK